MATTNISRLKLNLPDSKAEYEIADATARAHIADISSNPHHVTADQVGLGAVANLDQSKAIKSIERNGNTFTATALDGTQTTFSQNTFNYAGSDSEGGAANVVKGSYTGTGGQQNPDYFGKGKVGFLMMNTPVNGNTQYKNWLIMDNYTYDDAGGATAIGVDRTAARAFIMQSDAKRTKWNNSAEVYTTAHKPSAGDVGAVPTSRTVNGHALTGDISVTKDDLKIGLVKNFDQSKAIKGISRSGKTFTYTCLDGTTGTFDQQDTTYSPATANTNGLMSATDKSNLDDVVTNLGGHTVGVNVPSDAKFTDTTYTASTQSKDGLMSSGDKAKLDGLSDGVIVSATAPTGNAKQIWVDTTNGGVAKYWTGSEWTVIKSAWG